MAVRVSSMELSPQVATPGPAYDTLESLYRDYAPSLLRLCKGRLSDASEAEDACHESLIKASRAISRFRRGERMWPWLATIAANECIDRLRNRQREAIRTWGFSPPEIPAPELARDSDSLNRIDILEEALRELPATYQTYIRLRHFEKWSYKKIALSYGVSLSAVKSTLLRARRALKVQVKNVAESKGQWPLPALVPAAGAKGGWLRDRILSARGFARGVSERAYWFYALNDLVFNAFVVNLVLAAVAVGAIGGSLQLSGAGPLDAYGSTDSPGRVTKLGGTLQSSPAGSTKSIVVSVPLAASGTSLTISGHIDRTEKRASVSGKIEDRLGEDFTRGNVKVDAYCDQAFTAELACRVLDAVP